MNEDRKAAARELLIRDGALGVSKLTDGFALVHRLGGDPEKYLQYRIEHAEGDWVAVPHWVLRSKEWTA